MNDLLTSMEEAREERIGIMMDSKVPNAIEAASDDLHKCEIKAVIRQCYPNGNKAAEYFNGVEKSRGKAAADRLRNDVRTEWKRRKIEEAGQA